MLRLLFVLILLAPLPASPEQPPVALSGIGVDYIYGNRIVFSAQLKPSAPVQSAELLFQAEGDPVLYTLEVKIPEQGASETVYELRNGLLPPFSRVTFWYRFRLGEGTIYESPRYSFNYIDNLYPWMSLESGSLRVHWYLGSPEFGSSALQAANHGYAAMQALFPNISADPVDIYIYNSAEDIQDSLSLGGYAWNGGRVDSSLDVALVPLTPGATDPVAVQSWVSRQLARLLLQRLAGGGWSSVPAWLAEGIAALVQSDTAAPDQGLLAQAIESKSAIALKDLCASMPAEPTSASLASAESVSFVRFLYRSYGASGLQHLVSAYAGGASCEEGSKRTFGYSLSQLERSWVYTVKNPGSTPPSLADLFPYLLVLVFVAAAPFVRFIGSPRKGSHDRKQSK